MLSLPSSKVASLGRVLLAIVVLGAEPTFAGDHGFTSVTKIHQHGSVIALPSAPVVGYSTVVPVTGYYSTWALPVPITYGLVSPVTASYYVATPNSLPYSTYGTSPVTGASSITASPLLKSASAWGSTASAVGQATADYLPEYNAFLQQENVKNPATLLQPAGVRPNPSDVAAFNQNHPQLVAVVGVDRLASIGRFLLTKRQDPNFRNNAVKLFEPLLGVYLPQYVALIDRFLDDLRQGPVAPASEGLTPMTSPPPAAPANPSPFSPPAASSGLVKDPKTGHFVATDADGIRVEFDESMKLISVTKADGQVITITPVTTSTAAR